MRKERNPITHKRLCSLRHKQFMFFLIFGNFRTTATFVERKGTFFFCLGRKQKFGEMSSILSSPTPKKPQPKPKPLSFKLIFFLTCSWDTAECRKSFYYPFRSTFLRIPSLIQFYVTLLILPPCKCCGVGGCMFSKPKKHICEWFWKNSSSYVDDGNSNICMSDDASAATLDGSQVLS